MIDRSMVNLKYISGIYMVVTNERMTMIEASAYRIRVVYRAVFNRDIPTGLSFIDAGLQIVASIGEIAAREMLTVK